MKDAATTDADLLLLPNRGSAGAVQQHPLATAASLCQGPASKHPTTRRSQREPARWRIQASAFWHSLCQQCIHFAVEHTGFSRGHRRTPTAIAAVEILPLMRHQGYYVR
eukprot:365720-Chlamydomonas_euryale.AAC.3